MALHSIPLALVDGFHVCAHMCVLYVLMHALVCKWRSEEGVLLYLFLPYSLKAEPLPEPAAYDFQLSWLPANTSNPSALITLSAGVIGKHSPWQAYYMDFET